MAMAWSVGDFCGELSRVVGRQFLYFRARRIVESDASLSGLGARFGDTQRAQTGRVGRVRSRLRRCSLRGGQLDAPGLSLIARHGAERRRSVVDRVGRDL